MKFTVLLAFLCFGIAYPVLSQEKPEIVTDRPDQTEAAELVPQGALQVETGFVYEKDHDHNIISTNYTYNTTLIKYGVNEHFELRFITEYLGERQRIGGEINSKIEGLSPLALGVKIKLADEKGFWPQAAMIGHISLRSGSKEFTPDYTVADFRFTLAHTISEKISFSYNVGAEWSGANENPEAIFLYTAALGYALSPKIGAFVESYSFFPERSKADHRFDGGITYKFTPVIQWDASAGVGLSKNAPDFFVSTGLSFRVFK